MLIGVNVTTPFVTTGVAFVNPISAITNVNTAYLVIAIDTIPELLSLRPLDVLIV